MQLSILCHLSILVSLFWSPSPHYPVVFFGFLSISTRISGALQSPADQLVQVDKVGNAWVAGYTESSLDGHTNGGGYDIFLKKFDAQGVHRWTRQRGGEGGDYARGLQADGVRRCFSCDIL